MPRDGRRYEPLPPLIRLPGFVWRRLPRAGRLAVVALFVGALVAVALTAPGIRETRSENEARERREAAERRERRTRELRALVRPRVIRVQAGAAAATMDVRAAITRDARRRTGDRIVRTECERLPRSRSGALPGLRLSCLAVTADFAPSAVTVGGSIGYPYRARVDRGAGRATYCRIFGVPGEGGLTAKQTVTTPRVCGG